MCHFQSNFAGLEVLNPFFAKPKKTELFPGALEPLNLPWVAKLSLVSGGHMR
jgi:hypothetical protein